MVEPEATGPSSRQRLLEHFSVPIEQQGSRWSMLWDQKDFLPWDAGKPSPALEDLLEERKSELGLDRPAGKRALVPGCGRGVDVVFFASHGVDAFGLEISASAIKAASEYAAPALAGAPEGFGKVRFEQGDFYKDEWVVEMGADLEGGFDYVYDYTFLCAMPPVLRPAWSKRMHQLVKPGTGFLICLEFPLYKPLETGGPPWGLTSTVYEELLSGGFERIARYMPKRTHKMGEGTDHIAIWRRKSAA